MKTLKERVLQSLKWKKGNKYCAKRLKITLEQYIRIKAEVKKELRLNKLSGHMAPDANQEQSYDLEKGEARLTAKTETEPKTPEEIIKLLKIDTSKWKLSRYWNKQMSDHWRVSALISKINATEGDYLEKLIEEWKPKKYKIDSIEPEKENKEEVCGVLSLQDIHFGKEGNDTIDIDYENTIKYLMNRSAGYYIDNLFYVVGGDLINMDTFHGTTTKGTPVDNSATATDTFMKAFDCLHWGINYIKQFCKTLTIVYIPGNHDRLTSFHLAFALSKTIECDQIVWDVAYKERKVHVWEGNFNAFEHGDSPSKNTPLVYASEFPSMWGRTAYRTLFTGHFHQNKKVEYITTSENVGFVHKTLPSLSKSDYYHYHKKYVGNRRSGVLELQSKNKGTVCEFTYTV